MKQKRIQPYFIMNKEHCIDTCNKLLRGERSAVETYDQALEKHGQEPAAAGLRQIRDDHAESVELLEKNVRTMGGVPDSSAGAWGAFANTVQAAANLFGANSAMEALQSGEKAGVNGYENALDDKEVMPECKELIRSVLLPRTHQHIAEIERLQKAA